MRSWYQRWRTLIGEAWRFGLVGGANVAINFVLFNALVIVLFSGSELKANLVATAFATTSSYLMNRSWTFRHRRTSRIPLEYVLFFVFNAAALTIELAVMGLAKYGLGLTALWALNLAKLLGLGLGTVFRFWTYRTFVFAGRPAAAQAPADAVASPVLAEATITPTLADITVSPALPAATPPALAAEAAQLPAPAARSAPAQAASGPEDSAGLVEPTEFEEPAEIVEPVETTGVLASRQR